VNFLAKGFVESRLHRPAKPARLQVSPVQRTFQLVCSHVRFLCPVLLTYAGWRRYFSMHPSTSDQTISRFQPTKWFSAYRSTHQVFQVDDVACVRVVWSGRPRLTDAPGFSPVAFHSGADAGSRLSFQSSTPVAFLRGFVKPSALDSWLTHLQRNNQSLLESWHAEDTLC
jgi:hypothetical protein